MSKLGYIYITINKITGKIYIGQHKRNRYDKKYLGSGKYLNNSINKYGKENFENYIIQWCYSKEEMCEKEKYWIKKYNSLDNSIGYNITPGGEWGDITAGLTKEDYKKYCEKRSKIQKIVQKKRYKNIEARRITGEASKRVWQRPEYREKISQSLKGKTKGLKNGCSLGGFTVKLNKKSYFFESSYDAANFLGLSKTTILNLAKKYSKDKIPYTTKYTRTKHLEGMIIIIGKEV